MKRPLAIVLVCLGLLLGLAAPAQAQRRWYGGRGYYAPRARYYGPRYYHAPPYRYYGNRYYYRPRPYYGPRYYGPRYYGPRYYRRPGPAVIIRP